MVGLKVVDSEIGWIKTYEKNKTQQAKLWVPECPVGHLVISEAAFFNMQAAAQMAVSAVSDSSGHRACAFSR